MELLSSSGASEHKKKMVHLYRTTSTTSSMYVSVDVGKNTKHDERKIVSWPLD